MPKPAWFSSVRALRLLLAGTILGVVAACAGLNVHADSAGATAPTSDSTPAGLRIATYNTSLFDDESGGLIRRLEAGDARARAIAAVLQRVRPDIVLLNEFDFDAAGRAADLFQQRYLQVAQPGGGEALHYAYRHLAPVNTGIASGLDLDRNGSVGGPSRNGGNDAWGYGLHPGQYGMLLLSRYPIDGAQVRSFQHFKWRDLPGARPPRDPLTGEPWYSAQAWAQFRLSSKSHWDVPVRTPLGVLHVLAAHPTPPVFDGPEQRNGRRNFDEIRLWAEYLSPGERPWLCDDQGRCGGLAADARFVIVGDYNADPIDGDGVAGAMNQLLQHPRINALHPPRSEGASERAMRYAIARQGDTATHTADFGAKTGTLRLDYVLPSTGWSVRGSGVFWPRDDTPEAALTEASDHRLVWIDVGGPPAIAD